jgi:hypothetical protein
MMIAANRWSERRECRKKTTRYRSVVLTMVPGWLKKFSRVK